MKKDNILNHETLKFIPWNEISETLQLDGRQEGYIIMPSTYNPGMKGPFILSVSTDFFVDSHPMARGDHLACGHAIYRACIVGI